MYVKYYMTNDVVTNFTATMATTYVRMLEGLFTHVKGWNFTVYVLVYQVISL